MCAHQSSRLESLKIRFKTPEKYKNISFNVLHMHISDCAQSHTASWATSCDLRIIMH